MSLRSLTGLAVASLLASQAWASTGAAEEIKVAQNRLKTETTPGLCSLDRSAAGERGFFDAFEEGASQEAAILAIHATCEKLQAYRKGIGRGTDLSPSVTVVVPKEGGAPMTATESRAEFAAALEASYREVPQDQMQTMLQEQNDAIFGMVREHVADYADFSGQTSTFLGVLGSDDVAAYLAQRVDLRVGNEHFVRTSVSAYTIVNGIYVVVAYTIPGDTPDVTETMLPEIKRVTRDLILLNEGDI
jgi:hypothetical protein